MGNSYTVRVNDTLDFEITTDEINASDIIKKTNENYHILHNKASYHSAITQSDFYNKTYTVTINNTSYTVRITDSLDAKIKAMGFATAGSKQVKAIKAPMPGLLLDILVTEGQAVKENEPLLILEAMKMENVILSPRDGVIKTISLSKNDTVDKSQLLIEFE